MVEIIKFGDVTKGFKSGLDKTLLESVVFATAQAKALAPVAEKDGGRLRQSIGWKTAKMTGGFEASDIFSIKPLDKQAYIGASVPYAIYQEFGTRFMVPQPFLRPAIDIAKGANVISVIAALNRIEATRSTKTGKTKRRIR